MAPKFWLPLLTSGLRHNPASLRPTSRPKTTYTAIKSEHARSTTIWRHLLVCISSTHAQLQVACPCFQTLRRHSAEERLKHAGLPLLSIEAACGFELGFPTKSPASSIEVLRGALEYPERDAGGWSWDSCATQCRCICEGEFSTIWTGGNAVLPKSQKLGPQFMLGLHPQRRILPRSCLEYVPDPDENGPRFEYSPGIQSLKCSVDLVS
jgi:hypothetical protein